MKRWRSALILAIVVLALGGLATWDEWQTKKDEQAEKDKNHLTDLTVDEVTTLDFVDQGRRGRGRREERGFQQRASRRRTAFGVSRSRSTRSPIRIRSET